MTGIPLEMPAQATAKKRARDGDDSEDVGAPRKRSREATPEQISQKSAQSDNPKKRSSGDELEEDKVSHKRRSNSGTPEKHAQSDTASINPVTGDGADDARPIATSGSVSHIEIVSITPKSPIFKLAGYARDHPWIIDDSSEDCDFDHDSDCRIFKVVKAVAAQASRKKIASSLSENKSTDNSRQSPTVKLETNGDPKSPSVTTSASHENVSSPISSPIIKLEEYDGDEDQLVTCTSDHFEHDSDCEAIPNISTVADNEKEILTISDDDEDVSLYSEIQSTDNKFQDKSPSVTTSASNPEKVSSSSTTPIVKVDIDEESKATPVSTSNPDNGFATSAFAKATSSFATIPNTSAFGTGFASASGGFNSAPGLSGGGLTSFASGDKHKLSSFASPNPSALGTFGTQSSSIGSGFKSTSTLGGGLSSFASSTKPALSSFASPKKSAFGTFGTFGTESTGGFKSVSTLGGGLTSFASSDKPASSSFTSSSKSAFGTLGTEPSTVGSALLPDPGPNGPESGEEGEKTIFTCKGKLFHFTNKEWKERGFGTFKVNSRDDDGKTVTRMIMRADGAGRVMLNSPVFKGMGFGNAKNEAPEGRRVFLTTTEDGNPVTLLLRAPNDATATELFEVLSDLQ